MHEISIEIDRITLTGLGATPERAEYIRTLIEVEVQRLLEGGGWPDRLTGGEVHHLNAPTLNLTEMHGDSHVANGLAQRIVQSVHGMQSQKQGE